MYFIFCYRPIGILVASLFFCFIIGVDFLVCEWRVCILACKGKPAVELTSTYYIDHRLKVKIRWQDIITIQLKHNGKGFYVIEYTLIQEGILMKQLKRRYSKWMCMLLSEKKYSCLHLVQVKGNKDEIFERIKHCHQAAMLSSNA